MYVEDDPETGGGEVEEVLNQVLAVLESGAHVIVLRRLRPTGVPCCFCMPDVDVPVSAKSPFGADGDKAKIVAYLLEELEVDVRNDLPGSFDVDRRMWPSWNSRRRLNGTMPSMTFSMKSTVRITLDLIPG